MKRAIFTIIGIIFYLNLFSQTKDTTCQSFSLFIDSTNATLETYIYKNCDIQELYLFANAIFSENDSGYHQSIDSIYITWEVNDTLTIEGNPLIYHFSNYEINTIKYHAVDQFGCSSDIKTTYYQNYPEIDFSNITLSDDTVNVGDIVYLEGINLNYSIINDYSANPKYIPEMIYDPPFLDTIIVSGFNSIINNIENIPDICLNMEHSFLGDWVIELTCPNGTMVTLEEQGGGNMFIGEPIDEVSDTLIGIGYDYCWSTNPIYGEMDDEANGNQSQNEILNSGSYTSHDDLSNLIGCPLNGEWILTIYDNWAIDDGFLFSWGVSNNKENNLSSSFTFNNIENNNTVIPTTTGINNYILEIHQGDCVYDTVLCVYARSGLFINEQLYNEISIFPNPTNNYININNLPKESTLYIYDLSGQILITEKLNILDNKINTSSLSKGVYYCKIQSSENYFFKLVIN